MAIEGVTLRTPSVSVQLHRRRRSVTLFFLGPALTVLLLLLAYPVFSSIWLSFTDAGLSAGRLEMPFVWFDNYVALVSDPAARNAVFNTLYFAAIEVVGVVSLGLAAALLLNHPMARWSGFRVLLLLPWAIAPVANAILW